MSSSCLHSLSEKEGNPIFGSRGVCPFAPQDKGDETETVTCGFNFLTFWNGKLIFREGYISMGF